jgi:Gas vesicle synthesis protein GvpL/GvpF
MSDPEQKNSTQNSHASPEGSAFYVYCIGGTKLNESFKGNLPTAIEDNVKLELVDNHQLTAVVSTVPLSSFNEEALQEKLTDASWTAIRAMRHEHVVEYFAKRDSVVPLRFGTIYLNRDGIKRMLNDKADQLLEIIERLRGREEWGVNVYADSALLRENITSLSPRLREMTESAESAQPGQAYLIKKKIEALKNDEAKIEVARVADEIEEKLAARSDGNVRLRMLKVENTEHGELKGKFAFLVSREQFHSFRIEAEELAQQLQPAGIKIELTGPWPAYNFALA